VIFTQNAQKPFVMLSAVLYPDPQLGDPPDLLDGSWGTLSTVKEHRGKWAKRREERGNRGRGRRGWKRTKVPYRLFFFFTSSPAYNRL